MAYTQADLNAIEEAIKSGALTVKYQDKEVTYRSLDELVQIRDMIRRDIGTAATSSRLRTNFKKSTDC